MHRGLIPGPEAIRACPGVLVQRGEHRDQPRPAAAIAERRCLLDQRVHVVHAREVALGEGALLALPGLGQPGDHRCGQSRVRAEELPRAGPKSLVDSPCRYSNGNTSVTFGVLRAHVGRIAEENRHRCPVSGSTRLSVTRGAMSSTAPALVGTHGRFKIMR